MHRQRMKRLVAFVLGLCLIFGLTPNMQVKVAADEETEYELEVVTSDGYRVTSEKQQTDNKIKVKATKDTATNQVTIQWADLEAVMKQFYQDETILNDYEAGETTIAKTKFGADKKITFDDVTAHQLVLHSKEQRTKVQFIAKSADPSVNINEPFFVEAGKTIEDAYTKLYNAQKDHLKKLSIAGWFYNVKSQDPKDDTKILDGKGKLVPGASLPKVTHLVVKAGLAPVQQKVTVKVSYLKPGSSTEYIEPTDQDVEIEVKGYKNIGELDKAIRTPKITVPAGGVVSAIYNKIDGQEVQYPYTPEEGDRLSIGWVVKDKEKDKNERKGTIYFDAVDSVITETSEDPYTKEKKDSDQRVVSRKVTIKDPDAKGLGSVSISPNTPTPNSYFDAKFNTMMEFEYWTKDKEQLMKWNQQKGEGGIDRPTPAELANPNKVNLEDTFYAKYRPMVKVEVHFYYTGDPGITIYTGKDYILRRPIVLYYSQGTSITIDTLRTSLDNKLGKGNTLQTIKYLDPESGIEKVFNLLPELATLDGNPMNILSEAGSAYDSNVLKYDGGVMHQVKLYYSYVENAVTVTFDIQVPNEQEAAKVGVPKPKVTERGMYIKAPTDWQPARRRGYTFQGWYPTQEDAAALTNEISFPYMVQDNITLFAGWEGNKVYIIYRYNNGMGTEYKLAHNGELIPEPSFPVPYWPGMKFSGWYMTLGPEKGIGINNPGPKEKEEKQEEGQANAQKQWPLKGFRLPIDDPYLGPGNTTPGYITNTVVNGPMLVDAMWTPLVTTSSLTKPDQAALPQVAANQVGTNPVNAANMPEAGEHNFSFVVGGFLALAAGIFLLKKKAF